MVLTWYHSISFIKFLTVSLLSSIFSAQSNRRSSFCALDLSLSISMVRLVQKSHSSSSLNKWSRAGVDYIYPKKNVNSIIEIHFKKGKKHGDI